MRLAFKQSTNIIVDLQRLGLPDEKSVGVVKRRAKKLGKKCRIMVITKTKKIIKFYNE
ncbi:hypothetical protein IJG78_01030 [Candidatus Saccharibacteria bacterium]|nr:hypothetical protein [Candidatus Saccharibacteria bacterium]